MRLNEMVKALVDERIKMLAEIYEYHSGKPSKPEGDGCDWCQEYSAMLCTFCNKNIKGNNRALYCSECLSKHQFVTTGR